MTTTPHFPLPYLFPSQAGKEITHNEALLIIDLLLHRRVVAVGTNPANLSTPQKGQAWIIASGATGDWAGRDGQIALFGAGGWRFIPPPEGMMLWDESVGHWMRRGTTAWLYPPAAPTISSNANQDQGARDALSAIIAALSQWGFLTPAA